MIEVMIALLIIGTTIVAVLGALVTTISSAAQHRNLATMGTVLESFAETARYDIQQQSTSLYSPCATAASYSIAAAMPTATAAGTPVTVFATGPFTAADAVTLTINSPTPLTISSTVNSQYLLGGATVAANGSIAFSFNVPAAALVPVSATPYSLSVSDAHSHAASAAFTDTATPDGGTSNLLHFGVSVATVSYWGQSTAAFVVSSVSCLPAQRLSSTQLITLLGTGPNNLSDTLSFVVTNPGFANGTGVAIQLEFLTSPLSGAASSTGTQGPISVQLQDASGNPVNAGSGGQVVTLSSSAGGGFASTLGGASSPTETLTVPAGVSTTPANASYYGNTLAGNALITAASTGYIPDTLAASVSPGAATQLVFSAQPGSDIATGGLATQPRVSVEDAWLNTETADNATTVTLAIGTNPPTGSGTLACQTGATGSTNTLTVTAQAGVASFAGCGITQSAALLVAGYTLKATSSPVHGTVTSSAFSITKSLPVITSPSSSAPVTIAHKQSGTVSVVGTAYAPGVQASVAGATVTAVTWNSALSVSVTLTLPAPIGANYSLVLTNPDGGTVTATNAIRSS